ncbi:MAG: PaaI family thioesterase [Bacillota bacterium]
MIERAPVPDRIMQLCSEAHPACFVCGPAQPGGLQVRFVPQADGSVATTFACEQGYEGYPGIVHGGVVACLLDGAMTNCLFSLGHVAFTADLHVRFRHPLCTGQEAIVRARVTRDASPLFVLEAQIMQAGQVKASAVGKFMEKDRPAVGGAR